MCVMGTYCCVDLQEMAICLGKMMINSHILKDYHGDISSQLQDGSKTVQESKPLHIRNRTGPESEKIESFGIESD